MKKIQLTSTLLALVFGVSADKIVLQNSGDSKVCQDTYLEETINNSYAEEKSLGLEVGSCPSCHEKRILIKYDLSSVPKDQDINSAVLSLYCTEDNASTGSNAMVYMPKADWVQSEADWFEYSEGNKWNKEGGDIGLKALATFEVKNDATDSWFEFDLTETIKEYVSGEKENRGFIILLDDVDNLYLESSEAENESQRPKLTIFTGETSVVAVSKSALNSFDYNVAGNEIRVRNIEGNDALISLYTLQGKEVSSVGVVTSSASLKTDELAKGSYVLRVTSALGTTSKLVQIQ